MGLSTTVAADYNYLNLAALDVGSEGPVKLYRGFWSDCRISFSGFMAILLPSAKRMHEELFLDAGLILNTNGPTNERRDPSASECC